MQKLQKMKILGIECQGIMMPNTIQPREYSTGGGADGILYNPSQPERQPQRALPLSRRRRVELELQLA